MIHYLSASAVNTENGVKHLAFCGEQLDYGTDKDRFQVANYSGPNKVTHFRCVIEYAKSYPWDYKGWAAMERRLRAEKAAGIAYNWETGEFYNVK